MNLVKQIGAKLLGRDQLFARNTHGGIHPNSFKAHSLRSRIMSTPIPPQLDIPIGDETTGTLTWLVNPGAQVQKYQKLAILELNSNECSFVPVHAPTSGVVDSFTQSVVADDSHQNQCCIRLITDGEDVQRSLEPISDYAQLSPSALIGLIRDAGIVGMGGAGYPTADKLDINARTTTNFLIVNAAECEPYITADEALLRERANEVVQGTMILMRASEAARCVIAIENSKPDAIAALESVLEDDAVANGCVELVRIPSKYPAGSERQLIHCVTGIEIASDSHPTDAGVITQNVGTVYAIYQAIVEGRPCISRITTLCGHSLKTPKNFETLIGTPSEFLFNLCGIGLSDNHRSILGGSMMGIELFSDQAVICKTTNCLIAASTEETRPPLDEQACIRCGFCADVCPVSLLPQQILAFSRTSDFTQLLSHGVMDCIECGACDYVCPSHIPLVSAFQESKKSIQSRQHSLETSEYWQRRFQFRQYRTKKEKELAQSKKSNSPIGPTATQPTASQAEAGESKIISKEQASKDIAAAVARVKARRDEKNK